ncbi:MAG: hypothetical protein Q7S19_02870 [bacterium]|nr:hypothetical protein [bacterium]
MDGINTQQTPSFIPKKPLVAKSDFSANLPGIFLFLSIVALIFSVGGYFVAIYREKAKNTEVENLQLILKKAQDQFQPNQVVNMTRFDAKLKIAENLLYLQKEAGGTDTVAHITLLPLFNLLSEKTLTTVRFKDFKYNNVDNQKIEIKMSGEAKGTVGLANYAAVAQQAREFSDTRVLQNVLVSDLNLGSANNVTFNLTMNVNPELISYTETLNNQQ